VRTVGNSVRSTSRGGPPEAPEPGEPRMNANEHKWMQLAPARCPQPLERGPHRRAGVPTRCCLAQPCGGHAAWRMHAEHLPSYLIPGILLRQWRWRVAARRRGRPAAGRRRRRPRCRLELRPLEQAADVLRGVQSPGEHAEFIVLPRERRPEGRPSPAPARLARPSPSGAVLALCAREPGPGPPGPGTTDSGRPPGCAEPSTSISKDWPFPSSERPGPGRGGTVSPRRAEWRGGRSCLRSCGRTAFAVTEPAGVRGVARRSEP
jgi:hypothetical protein